MPSPDAPPERPSFVWQGVVRRLAAVLSSACFGGALVAAGVDIYLTAPTLRVVSHYLLACGLVLWLAEAALDESGPLPTRDSRARLQRPRQPRGSERF